MTAVGIAPSIGGRSGGGSGVVHDLVSLGVGNSSTTATAAGNAAVIAAAWAVGTLDGLPVYLRGAKHYYPTNTLTLPSEPVTFIGDGCDVSTLGTTAGTILTYSPTTSPLTGATDPWSTNSTDMVSALHYRSKAWQISGIGFTKTDNWSNNTGTGLDFPTWNGTSDSLVMWMSACKVTNFNGTGISFLLNGTRQESVFTNVLVDGCKNEGVIYGSDQWWVGCHSNNNGFEGFWTQSRNGFLVGCKAYSNGTLNNTTRNAGFYVKGGANGGVMLSACYAQDNRGPGLQLDGVARVTVQGFTADRNCWRDGTVNTAEQAGVWVADSTDVIIDGLVATDSNQGVKTNVQTHALKVTNTGGNTNARNKVGLVQSSTGSQTLGTPVDNVNSDLNGTHVIVGASDGGEYTVAFAAAVTPDPYQAQTWVIGALTAGITINAPANGHKGSRLRIKFLQDGTGGRAVTWNAVFKQAFVTTNNTAGKVSIAEFEFDGTNWIQVNSNLWV
jgi:hypothetical protein